MNENLLPVNSDAVQSFGDESNSGGFKLHYQVPTDWDKRLREVVIFNQFSLAKQDGTPSAGPNGVIAGHQ